METKYILYPNPNVRGNAGLALDMLQGVEIVLCCYSSLFINMFCI